MQLIDKKRYCRGECPDRHFSTFNDLALKLAHMGNMPRPAGSIVGLDRLWLSNAHKITSVIANPACYIKDAVNAAG